MPDDEATSGASPGAAGPGPESAGSTPGMIEGSYQNQLLQNVAIGSGNPDAYYRALYATEPDFRQLGKQDAEFASLYVFLSLSSAAAAAAVLTFRPG